MTNDAPAPSPRGRRGLFIGIGAAVVALALAAGVFVTWTRADSSRQQREVAERVAASLSKGAVAGADFEAADPAPPAAYATIIKGMRGLKPTVSVKSVTEHDDANAEAVLSYSWPIPGQQPWTYDVSLPLHRATTGWLGVWSPTIVAPGLSPDERLLYNRLAPARGAIRGQNGDELAFNQPAVRVGIDKTKLVPSGWELAARELATTLTKAGTAVDPKTYVAKVRAAGPQAFVEAAVLRTNDEKQSAAAKKVATMPGVLSTKVTRALGLTSGFLRPILGQVGDATAEIVSASGGVVVAGDMVGTAGLQRSLDTALRGHAGYVVQAMVSNGNRTRENGKVRDLIRVKATAGTDVQTTIDRDLQQAAEKILSSVKPASAIVAIRPSDGALLTIASGPGNAGVVSTATQALYEPGSTFKTVSGLAMIRHGLKPTSTLPCTASINVDGYTFDNDLGYPSSALGKIPWTTAFAHSCNTAVISQANKVSQQDLASAARALGLIDGPAIGTAVTASKVPSSAASKTEHAASMIGQGKVVTTPYGMATVTASIAKGDLVRPVLVTSPKAAPATEPAGITPVTSGEAKALRTLMRSVVTGGTASSALAGTPGGKVIAKTGTSTYIKDGKKRYHTWLIAAQGDLAVSVMVADGDYGAATCGPLLKKFLTAAHNG